jgi:hypothetical protein
LVIKPPTTYPENIIADRVWDDVRSDVGGSGLDSIANTIDLGANGDYHSCNPQNRCLTISHTKSIQRGRTQIWKNAGYTHQVTPLGSSLLRGKYTRVSDKIIDPKLRVISNRIFRYQ